jgi:hypothetical protein
MRINEIIKEDTAIDEARPLGILNRIGQTALSMTPTNVGKKAKGTIETGEKANQIMNQYMQWLGKNHYEENKESLLSFLKQSGLSDDAVQAASKVLDNGQVQQSTTPQQSGTPATQPAPTQQPPAPQNNTMPHPNPVSEAVENQSTKLDSKIISQAIMAAVVQQVRSGHPMNNVGTQGANGVNQRQPTASTSPSVSGTVDSTAPNTASSNNTVDQVGTTADSTQPTQPTRPAAIQTKQEQHPSGPTPEQEVIFPGTTPPVVFKYNPQWVDTNGNPAASDMAAVLNQMAIGQEPSIQALKKARMSIGLPENEKIKKNSIVEFHSNFLGKDI